MIFVVVWFIVGVVYYMVMLIVVGFEVFCDFVEMVEVEFLVIDDIMMFFEF